MFWCIAYAAIFFFGGLPRDWLHVRWNCVKKKSTCFPISPGSCRSVRLHSCCTAIKILANARRLTKDRTFAALCLINTRTHKLALACVDKHVHTDRDKKDLSRAAPPPAQLLCDSSPCRRVAIRGTQPTSTSLAGCRLSFIQGDPAKPRGHSRRMLLLKCLREKKKEAFGRQNGAGGEGAGRHQGRLTGKRVTQGQRGDK